MIKAFNNIQPIINDNVFIAENADVIGDVVLGEFSSVWYKAVIRGDVNSIRIGRHTNIQDGTILHVSDDYPLVIGDYVSIGHNATVHGCKIGSNCLIGMGSIIMDGSTIEDNVIIGAGSIVPPGKKIPTNSLAFGSPAKIIRKLEPEEIEQIKDSAITYVKLWNNYE